MAALLVGMSIMAVLMGAALPVWNKQAQREREEEYLFRATEYARAIQKFQRKAGPETLPPNFDVLVEGRFLRRKYKDPLSGGDFQPVFQTVAAPGQPGRPGGVNGNPTPGGFVGATPTAQSGGTSTAGTGGTPTAGTGAPMPGAGVIGVVSKSKGESIKIYNGRTRYDQWAVTYRDVKPGRGLPPDLLQAVNAGRGGQGGGGGVGTGGGQGGNPFGQPGTPPGGSPFGQPGGSPFGQPGGGNPFGQPGGGNPFGQPGGANPFGRPGAPGQPPAPGGQGTGSPFGTGAPSYPPLPLPGGGIFGQPPKRP